MALGSTVNKVVDYEYRTSGAGQAAGQMQGLITKAALLAAAYKAASAATDFMRDSITAAVDANEDWNKFVVVMGENAEAVNAELETFADTTNRNVYELRALSAGIQDMLVPMGVARDEAAGLSTDFVKLATDPYTGSALAFGGLTAALQVMKEKAIEKRGAARLAHQDSTKTGPFAPEAGGHGREGHTYLKEEEMEGEEEEAPTKTSVSDFSKGASQRRKDISAGGVTDAERSIIVGLQKQLAQAAKSGNITSGKVARILKMLSDELRKISE